MTRPGHYVVHRDGQIYVEQGDIYDQNFQRDCSWFVRKDIFFPGQYSSQKTSNSEILKPTNEDKSHFITETVFSPSNLIVQYSNLMLGPYVKKQPYMMPLILVSGFTSFESVYRPGFFIRHKNRRLQVSQLFSSTDRSDASFLMSDAYSSATVEVSATEEWRKFMGINLQVKNTTKHSIMSFEP